jgi:hypothetical protein
MMKIRLSNGMYTKVDDDQCAALKQIRWYSRRHSTTGKWYATNHEKGRSVQMHRFILKAPDGMHVDHINGNGLDNRRSNLRLATSAQNAQNRDRFWNNTTGYKGVSRQKGRRKFRAQIYANRKAIYLGWYDTAQEAARAYDKAVPIYHGEFGCTNF